MFESLWIQWADRLVKWASVFSKRIMTPKSYCYFPSFSSLSDWTDQYYRACWYLPYHPEACHQVRMVVSDKSCSSSDLAGLAGLEKPDYFGEIPAPANHIHTVRGTIAMWIQLFRSETILVWRLEGDGNVDAPAVQWMRRLGKSVVYVDRYRNQSPNGYYNEYTNYVRILWDALPEHARQKLIGENHDRFKNFAKTFGEDVNPEGRKCSAYLFGNGPSLLQLKNYSELEGIRVACNTIVAEADLLAKISPHFIAAVDPESHYGPSRYSHQFRKDWAKALAGGNCLGIGTLPFALPLMIHEPALAERICFLPKGHEWTFNLLERFSMSELFGVFSTVMLPVATTFCRNIYLIGFDGVSPGSHERKPWEYAPGVQYWDLMKDRFRCHPSLRLCPAGVAYWYHHEAARQMVAEGIRRHGARFHVLGTVKPSFLEPDMLMADDSSPPSSDG